MTNNTLETIHLHRESREHERGFEPDRLEVAKTTELKIFTQEVLKILEKISHDDTITMGDMHTFKTVLEAMRVSTGVNTASLAEFEESEEWRGNALLWEKIRAGSKDDIDFLRSVNDATTSLTLITSEVARILSALQWDMNLNKLVHLSPQCAEAFSTHKWGLSLDSLEYISDDAARMLGRRKVKNPDFRGLSLNGIKHLTESAADGLNRHEGYLVFKGLSDLSEEVAFALGKHRIGYLSLGDGSLVISKEAAEGLSHHKDTVYIYTDSISDEALMPLARRKGDLHLFDLESLSDTAAEYLGQHEGSLMLGISSLSDTVAWKLSTHKGSLFFNNLETLSDIAAEALAQTHGKLKIWWLRNISEHAAYVLAHKANGDVEVKDDEGKAMIDNALMR